MTLIGSLLAHIETHLTKPLEDGPRTAYADGRALKAGLAPARQRTPPEDGERGVTFRTLESDYIIGQIVGCGGGAFPGRGAGMTGCVSLRECGRARAEPAVRSSDVKIDNYRWLRIVASRLPVLKALLMGQTLYCALPRPPVSAHIWRRRRRTLKVAENSRAERRMLYSVHGGCIWVIG